MWQAGFGKSGSDRFHDGAISMFRHTILLQVIVRCVTWHDAGCRNEVGEFVAHELTAFVVLECLDLATSLVLRKHLEHQEGVERFQLLLERIGSMIRACIVVEQDEVVVAGHGIWTRLLWTRSRTPVVIVLVDENGCAASCQRDMARRWDQDMHVIQE